MREIKFRARYGDSFIYTDYDEDTYNNGCFLTLSNGEFYVGHSQNNSDWFIDEEKVGQYVGLEDKNGKEMYEGDIVKKHVDNKYRNIGPGLNKKKPIYRNYIVRWEGIGFKFICLEKTPNILETGPQTLEIIGNIYENPDLLDKKPKGQ